MVAAGLDGRWLSGGAGEPALVAEVGGPGVGEGGEVGLESEKVGGDGSATTDKEGNTLITVKANEDSSGR
jgi:hypothetical protein